MSFIPDPTITARKANFLGVGGGHTGTTHVSRILPEIVLSMGFLTCLNSIARLDFMFLSLGHLEGNNFV